MVAGRLNSHQVPDDDDHGENASASAITPARHAVHHINFFWASV